MYSLGDCMWKRRQGVKLWLDTGRARGRLHEMRLPWHEWARPGWFMRLTGAARRILACRHQELCPGRT